MRLASLGTWQGKPQWRCALCPATALSAHQMAAHLRAGHRIAADRIDLPQAAEAKAKSAAEAPDSGKEQ